MQMNTLSKQGKGLTELIECMRKQSGPNESILYIFCISKVATVLKCYWPQVLWQKMHLHLLRVRIVDFDWD